MHFASGALGLTLDPWQCDVLDAVADPDAKSIAIRACHGVGKTLILGVATVHFLTTRPNSETITTAPTFNKQVRDVLWGQTIHQLWRRLEFRWSWLATQFELLTTRLQHRENPGGWFATGIASSKAVNMEGYHAEHVMVVIDEAKGVPQAAWEAIYGARTTRDVKLIVGSTPGAPSGEFFKVFKHLRQTWRHTYIIHPAQLRESINVPEVMGEDPLTRQPVRGRYARFGGVYYSSRPLDEWVEFCREEWGEDSAVFIARVRGDFPELAGDNLYPYSWIEYAANIEQGAPGRRVVACDVARYGRDRTTFLVLEGGTGLHAETIAKNPVESTAPETHIIGVGDDPKRPAYRALDVTADICARLRREWECETIVIDDTGLNGVADFLKRRGESVVPVNFGATPTDRPENPEDRRWRERRHLLDSQYVNIKAEMAWTLRRGLEVGSLALGNLPEGFLRPLIAQLSLIKGVLDGKGRQRVVDPDEQDDYAIAAGNLEGKKSPDHFHALLLGWWVAGGGYRRQIPRAAAVLPPGLSTFGEPTTQIGRITAGPTGGGVGGQAGRVERWYRR